MKLLFVFTGGTIGSTRHGDVISTDKSKSYKIIEEYEKRYGIDFEYDTEEPYTELSENNTGEQIRKLCACVKSNINKDYDGIIITHGTDTLQYTAAALGYALGLDSIPVCLVSSNRPIEDERANGLENLRGAVRFIEDRCGRGAFVIYRNDRSDTIRAHRGTRLLGAKAYSDDVSSAGSVVYGHFLWDVFVKAMEYAEPDDEMSPIDMTSLTDMSETIQIITPYPGMIYPEISEGVRYIILNTYHSGTINTKSQATRDFCKKASERGITVFASGVSGGADYESATLYESLGIIPAKNISPVALYIKCWALACASMSVCDNIFRPLSGDITTE